MKKLSNLWATSPTCLNSNIENSWRNNNMYGSMDWYRGKSWWLWRIDYQYIFLSSEYMEYCYLNSLWSFLEKLSILLSILFLLIVFKIFVSYRSKMNPQVNLFEFIFWVYTEEMIFNISEFFFKQFEIITEIGVSIHLSSFSKDFMSYAKLHGTTADTHFIIFVHIT